MVVVGGSIPPAPTKHSYLYLPGVSSRSRGLW